MRLQLKRIIGVLGLAAMAAMLVTAMGATSAYAKPEFAVKATEKFPVTFKGEGGLAKFLGSKLNQVLCHDSTSTGEVTSSTDAKVTILYLSGCETKGAVNETCPDIKTNELLIVPLSNLNLGTKLGLLVLAAKAGETIATFKCNGGTEVKVTGSVVCESTPGGLLVTKGQVICKEGTKHGEQEFKSGEDSLGSTMVGGSLIAEAKVFEFFKEKEPDSQETTEKVTYSKEIEQVH